MTLAPEKNESKTFARMVVIFINYHTAYPMTHVTGAALAVYDEAEETFDIAHSNVYFQLPPRLERGSEPLSE